MGERRNRSVRVIVLAGSLVAAIIPALILGLGSGLAFRSMVIEDNIQRGTELAHALAERFDQIQEDQTHIISLVGKELGNVDASDLPDANNVLIAAVQELPFATRLSYLNAKGVVIASRQPGQATPTADNIGTDFHDRGYFQQVMTTRRAVVDRTILPRLNQAPVVVVAAPVIDVTGTVRGVLSESLDLTRLQAEASDIRLGTTGQATIVDGGGNLVVSPDAQLMKTHPNLTNLAVWNQVSGADAGRLEQFLDPYGVPRLGGFATVATSGWKIWVSRTTTEIDAQVIRVYAQVMIWVAAAILLAVIAAYWLSRRISNPIEALRTTASEIAAGHLEARAPETGPDDVVVLARAMNGMADSIKAKVEAEQATRRKLQDTVREYGLFAERVAGGDLSVRVGTAGGDELGQLGGGLNRMTESLAQLVGEIGAAVVRVESSASEIMAATSQQVAATSEQATAVRQTATTVAEVRQTAEVAARKTRDVAELAQQIESTAEGGRRSVEDSVRGSEEARERIEALAQKILVFSDQAQEIAEINATVGDLAEQSNLLAVNASIEAAKAGEAGRGFGVVAGEIKELADRCKEATGQVRRIVSDIQKSAQGAVMAAEQGVKMAGEVSEVAQRSGAAITSLSDSVVQASQAAQQINASAEQQEIGMDQIVLSMRNIEQASGQTVAATQQVERAAKDLTELARTLAGLIRTTKLESAA